MAFQKYTNESVMEIAGLAPCAGYAARISPLPCSKEIYPVGFYTSEDGSSRPKPIASYLLENMKAAGAEHVTLVIRKWKWDIPEYFGNGKDAGIPLNYVVSDPTPGAAFTVDEAYPFLKGKQILFGFPDIYIKPKDAFSTLLKRLNQTKADVVLGLFKADNPEKVDMVEIGGDGKILKIVIKPRTTSLTHTWLLAAWGPRFTRFIHDYVSAQKNESAGDFSVRPGKKEHHVGNVIDEAIESGLHVNSVTFSDGKFLDIGTADDLRKAPGFIEDSV